MGIRKALFLSLCIAGSAMLAPVVASAAVGIDITVAPPAPQWRLYRDHAPAMCGRQGFGNGVAMRTSGFLGAGWVSARAGIGFPIVGNSAETTGTTGGDIGSGKRRVHFAPDCH